MLERLTYKDYRALLVGAKMRYKNNPQMTESLNAAIDLLDLRADGRLVVLPCKVGESVYAIVNCADIIKSCDDDYFTGTGAISCSFEKDCPFEECDDGNRGVFETACKGFWVDDEGRLNVFLDYINANIGPLDFGKTVFLTREAAEKAIAEVGDTNKVVPQSCYAEFGADLDGCSRQESQGCVGCRCLEAGV